MGFSDHVKNVHLNTWEYFLVSKVLWNIYILVLAYIFQLETQFIYFHNKSNT